MKTFKSIKRNGGFVILFAVTLSSIILAIALGIANIALKEVKFGTSAISTNNAFFAADTAIESVLFRDRTSGSSYLPVPGTWNEIISGLGSGGQGCAKVTIDKTVPPVTTIISKGYNIGDASCTSSNPDRIERELKTTYTSGSSTPPPAQIFLRSSAQTSSLSGVPTLSINKPNNTAQNDVLVASVGIRPNTAVITPPSGWTLVRKLNNPASSASNALATYYKIAGASEPANYSWSFDTSLGSAGGIMSFANVNTSNPINIENGQNTPQSLNSPTPSVDTTVANTMIITIHGIPSSPTWTPPSGMTEAVDVASFPPYDNGGESVEMNYILQSVAGSTGVKTAVQNTSGGLPGPDYGNAEILVLQP